MAITKPNIGDSDWGVALNAALTALDTRWSPVAVPATATSTGAVGQFAYSTTYFYICVATNTWRRVAISSW